MTMGSVPLSLVIATQNEGKVLEFRRILEPFGIGAVSCRELGINSDVEETGSTFAENARMKAKAIAALSGKPAVADDSGLCVDALDGAPGVYSARYAGPDATDADRVGKLLEALREVPSGKRGARFVCAICCVFPDGTELMAEGVCEGWIDFAPHGDGGFGYDPVFRPLDAPGGSFSELSGEEKDAVSHRGKALRLFCEALSRRV